MDNNIFRKEIATAEDPIADNRTNYKDITLFNISERKFLSQLPLRLKNVMGRNVDCVPTF